MVWLRCCALCCVAGHQLVTLAASLSFLLLSLLRILMTSLLQLFVCMQYSRRQFLLYRVQTLAGLRTSAGCFCRIYEYISNNDKRMTLTPCLLMTTLIICVAKVNDQWEARLGFCSDGKRVHVHIWLLLHCQPHRKGVSERPLGESRTSEQGETHRERGRGLKWRETFKPAVLPPYLPSAFNQSAFAMRACRATRWLINLLHAEGARQWQGGRRQGQVKVRGTGCAGSARSVAGLGLGCFLGVLRAGVSSRLTNGIPWFR